MARAADFLSPAPLPPTIDPNFSAASRVPPFIRVFPFESWNRVVVERFFERYIRAGGLLIIRSQSVYI